MSVLFVESEVGVGGHVVEAVVDPLFEGREVVAEIFGALGGVVSAGVCGPEVAVFDGCRVNHIGIFFDVCLELRIARCHEVGEFLLVEIAEFRVCEEQLEERVAAAFGFP